MHHPVCILSTLASELSSFSCSRMAPTNAAVLHIAVLHDPSMLFRSDVTVGRVDIEVQTLLLACENASSHGECCLPAISCLGYHLTTYLETTLTLLPLGSVEVRLTTSDVSRSTRLALASAKQDVESIAPSTNASAVTTTVDLASETKPLFVALGNIMSKMDAFVKAVDGLAKVSTLKFSPSRRASGSHLWSGPSLHRPRMASCVTLVQGMHQFGRRR